MNRSIIIAVALFIVISMWVVSWSFFGKEGDTDTQSILAFQDKPLMKVNVREQEAELIEKTVVISGRTAAARRVEVRAQTSGAITNTGIPRGSVIEKGEIIATLEIRDRQERLEQAQASLDQTQMEYEAAKQLSAKGYQWNNVLAGLLSAVKQAEVQVKAYSLDLQYIYVRAPISGILHERTVEIGDFVNVGDIIGIVLEMDPLIVRGEVTEHDVIYLKEGQTGRATLANGRAVNGFIRYVAPQSDERSRTFLIELQVANPDYDIPAGITAESIIPVEILPAHKISPAALSLGEAGELGIKTIDDEQIVQFTEVELVKSTNLAVWLGGLPQTIKVITIGHGFVRPGDKVEPMWEIAPEKDVPKELAEDNGLFSR